MFYALSWLVVFMLLALWSLAAWTIHAIAAWTISHAADLAGGSGPLDALRLPDWLAPWVPPELLPAIASMLSAFGPAIETLLGWAPSLAGGLSLLIWVIWALGSALLVVLGVVLSGLVALQHRRSTRPAAPGRTSSPWTRHQSP